MASFRVFAVFLAVAVLAFDGMVEGWGKGKGKGWGNKKGWGKGKKSSGSSSSDESSSSGSSEEAGLCDEVKELLELTECSSCQNPEGKWKKKCDDAQATIDCIRDALCDDDPTQPPTTTTTEPTTTTSTTTTTTTSTTTTTQDPTPCLGDCVLPGTCMGLDAGIVGCPAGQTCCITILL